MVEMLGIQWLSNVTVTISRNVSLKNLRTTSTRRFGRETQVNLCRIVFRNIEMLMFQWFNARATLVINYQIMQLVSGS